MLSEKFSAASPFRPIPALEDDAIGGVRSEPLPHDGFVAQFHASCRVKGTSGIL